MRQEPRKANFQDFKGKESTEQIFINLANYTDMVIMNIQPSLVITGAPGTGKTHQVLAQCEKRKLKENVDFVHVKGRTSMAGMYMTLYENSDKLVIFDDCDSVFKDQDAVNMLKAALDSYDKRVISYISTKPIRTADGEPMPRSFNFKGKVIFISNIDQKKVDPAIKSRSFVVDITLTSDQLIERMRHILDKIEPNQKMGIKKDALKALREAYDKFDNVELNFRSLIKAIRIRSLGFENWPMLVAEQCVAVKKK